MNDFQYHDEVAETHRNYADKCDQCEELMINGVRCHEQGCPNMWKDEVRECKWCGDKFRPRYKWQRYCSDECHRAA